MSDVLDLDGRAPHTAPKGARGESMSVRVTAHDAAWVDQQAAAIGLSRNAYMVRMIRQAQRDELPADVTSWLLAQAAMCGHPNDPRAGLIEVVRHLAKRWPHGARLNS